MYHFQRTGRSSNGVHMIRPTVPQSIVSIFVIVPRVLHAIQPRRPKLIEEKQESELVYSNASRKMLGHDRPQRCRFHSSRIRTPNRPRWAFPSSGSHRARFDPHGRSPPTLEDFSSPVT